MFSYRGDSCNLYFIFSPLRRALLQGLVAHKVSLVELGPTSSRRHLRYIDKKRLSYAVFELSSTNGNRFGSGALVFTPLINSLMEKFAKMPTYLGTVDQVGFLE